jgi:pimeloyl-ACP methyl ester carboxylesterase
VDVTSELRTARAGDLQLSYRELGEGPAVLLLHGWPTSSFLWRKVMRPIAASNRVIAVDLPGYGFSDKPLDVRYDFAFFGRALDDFLGEFGVEEVGLAVHDIGGPIGVHWALRSRPRVNRLALLNTVLYPQLSDAATEFLRRISTPGLREEMTGKAGLEAGFRAGLADPGTLTDEVAAAVVAPFASDDARTALAKAAAELSPSGLEEIAAGLPTLEIPVRIVYGEQDRLLPDVAETARRVVDDVPYPVTVTALPDCGHFLQEEQPELVGRLLADFFAD